MSLAYIIVIVVMMKNYITLLHHRSSVFNHLFHFSHSLYLLDYNWQLFLYYFEL